MQYNKMGVCMKYKMLKESETEISVSDSFKYEEITEGQLNSVSLPSSIID